MFRSGLGVGGISISDTWSGVMTSRTPGTSETDSTSMEPDIGVSERAAHDSKVEGARRRDVVDIIEPCR